MLSIMEETSRRRGDSERRTKARVGLFWHGNGVWHGGRIYRENVARILGRRWEIEPVILVKDAEEASRIADEFATYEIVMLERIRERAFAAFQEKKERLQLQVQEQRRLQVSKVSSRWKWKIWKPLPEFTDRSPSLAKLKPPTQADILRELISQYQIDLLFPLPGLEVDDIPGVSWIPDFQHRYLRELFSAEEYRLREELFGRIAKQRDVLLSSEDCRSHFEEIYPESAARLSVWQFCAQIPETMLAIDPEEVRKRYQLPEAFFLVSNQFWKHKDHHLVINALDDLGNTDVRPIVVFTGALHDQRGENHIDKFLQAIQERGLHHQVRILGFLPRCDQIALMRRALAVIHPSRFEGWSTVVEDCRSLGQRLILSDLAVHREQDPPASIFFPVGDSKSLASKIALIASEPTGVWENERVAREIRARTVVQGVQLRTEEKLIDIFLGAIIRWRELKAGTPST